MAPDEIGPTPYAGSLRGMGTTGASTTHRATARLSPMLSLCAKPISKRDVW